MRVLVWIAGLAPLAVAVPSSSYRVVAARADNTSASVAPSQNVSGAAPPELIVYTLPCEDGNSTARTAEIRLKQATLLYGPSLLGNASYFPGGPLGDAISLRDQTVWEGAAVVQSLRAFTDAAKVAANIKQNGGLNSLDDFKVLYQDGWKGSVPQGIARGQSENYTSDLLFSMERLSVNPYILKRLHPTEDALPFQVDRATVKQLTKTSLKALHAAGRLFVADHSYQRNYTRLANRYSAACTALFYLDPRSNQFLPLAIKTNVGADLTYTPLDTDNNNWLLAKIMFNNNDLFHGQIFHVAYPHAIAEIVHLAALRTMSARHPVLALMERLMYQAYAVRPLGERVLFNKGGLFEQNFAYPQDMVYKFVGDSYPTTGRWRAGYLDTDVRARGLVDADYGPELPHFPFYEDGSRLVEVIRRFVRSFVDATYHESDEMVAKDAELQAWVAEANGPAGVKEFEPGPLDTRERLVEVLTHMAWLTGCAHHVLNQGEPVTASGVLPMHPTALYAPVPTSKANTTADLLGYLPSAQKSVDQVTLLARFNRPDVVPTNQTLRYMFAAPQLLLGNGEAYRRANQRFVRAMGRISDEVKARRFDDRGLSQGMPFIWQALDPGNIPFYLSV
ncbi:hypothetical protein MCOR27_009870 [Pyricularia oryzae]|uniref:Manganese lipoxygenase n=1 Tax=Pyricularia grisea TaxID=148305 RepID=A0ABQ8NCD6_PYRGI|nr:hypothetical protein MCOR01_005318 [Pyricularia oryzae]KAI6294412.1 hypothetical protein MCOR33_008469 [Pyricularia grisea]KAI6268403.1 hypothetical protein MCOR26_009219 [Pyricularia oryzae]KAI6269127.1 hypothetical protein MCOR27_009870 [Pyricularia oryzae]KAI6335632.1 hypothetical protein MCOR28_009587 [Pyricularia oryzae]